MAKLMQAYEQEGSVGLGQTRLPAVAAGQGQGLAAAQGQGPDDHSPLKRMRVEPSGVSMRLTDFIELLDKNQQAMQEAERDIVIDDDKGRDDKDGRDGDSDADADGDDCLMIDGDG